MEVELILVRQYVCEFRNTLDFLCEFYCSGETDANFNGIVQGHKDWPLNETGHRQAAAAGRVLRSAQFDAVFSSDLSRAGQTAEGIVRQNEHFKGDIQRWSSLRERSFGTMEDRPTVELKEAARAANSEYFKFTPEGGETLEQLFDRCRESFQRLLGEMRQLSKSGSCTPLTILVVSHGGTLGSMLRYLVAEQDCTFAETDRQSWRRLPRNTAISRFRMTVGSQKKVEKIVCDVLFNSAHLDEDEENGLGRDVLKSGDMLC